MGEESNRIRIVDIAEELGVSTATVSNVIHGKTKKISDETVKRVQYLLEERKYIPSMAAMLLAQNSSKIIGVVINNHYKYERRVLEDPFINNALDNLYDVIEKQDYFMMIKCTDNCDDIIQYASMWNMEGLIIMGFCEQEYDRLRSGMHIPFVVYDGFSKLTSRYANVFVDNEEGGYRAGKYLISKGHSKIMFLADNNICMDLERFLGLRKAMQEAKLETPEDMYYIIPQTERERRIYYREHLQEFRNYTAAFAASDVYAIEFMNFLQDNGVSVPDDVSIIGFDDIPECKIVRPKLTTIHQDGRMRAELAIEMLMNLQDAMATADNYRILPVSLVERDSVIAPCHK